MSIPSESERAGAGLPTGPAGRSPWTALVAAKQRIAADRSEAQARAATTLAVGDQFRRDAVEAASLLPAAMQRHAAPGSSNRALHEGIEIITAPSGMAGGTKALHEGHGLFLKIPDNGLGIYPSDELAAKATKLEVNAAAAVHAIDTVHFNTPLMTVVDVPTSSADGHAATIQRVMVQAQVPLAGSTLCCGSADGGHTMHFDPEQDEAVVLPLAEHFHLKALDGGYQSASRWVKHWVEVEPVRAAGDDAGSRGLAPFEVDSAAGTGASGPGGDSDHDDRGGHTSSHDLKKRSSDRGAEGTWREALEALDRRTDHPTTAEIVRAMGLSPLRISRLTDPCATQEPQGATEDHEAPDTKGGS